MKRLLTITAVVMFLCGCGKNNEIVYVLANDSYRCEDFEVIKEKMVVLINRARAQSRNCGYKIYTPAGEVTWNPTLARAALDHSVDMATGDFVSHSGSDGSHVDERVEELDYAVDERRREHIGREGELGRSGRGVAHKPRALRERNEGELHGDRRRVLSQQGHQEQDLLDSRFRLSRRRGFEEG